MCNKCNALLSAKKGVLNILIPIYKKDNIYNLCNFISNNGLISRHYQPIIVNNYIEKLNYKTLKVENGLNKQLYTFLEKYHDNLYLFREVIHNCFENATMKIENETTNNTFNNDIHNTFFVFYNKDDWLYYLNKNNINYDDILQNNIFLKNTLYQLYLNDFIKEEKQKPFGKQLLKWAVAAMLIGAIFSCGWWMFSNENDLSNNLSSFISFDSIFKSVSTFKNKTVIAEKKTAVKNNSAEEEKHPYTFYLTNPSEGYYLITYEGLDFEGANHQKLKYWRDGIDARIIQTDSTYQIGLYYFTTIDAIQEIKKSTDSMMHSDCKLLKALN